MRREHHLRRTIGPGRARNLSLQLPDAPLGACNTHVAFTASGVTRVQRSS